VSRKNLSRTVIEGGRYYSNCWLRRASHGVERATTREWLDRVAVDLEEADATVAPSRPHVRKMFHDKLAPAHRWLVAQVGRPWSAIYSELCARFDTRTVAGRHVVHDHMLQWVRKHDELDRRHSRRDLIVDAHGILRKPRWFGRSYSKLRAHVLGWAAGRVCALTDRGWWWFRHEPHGRPCANGSLCSHARHPEFGGVRYHAKKLVAVGPMSRKQVRRLERIPDGFRRAIVVQNPWRRDD